MSCFSVFRLGFKVLARVSTKSKTDLVFSAVLPLLAGIENDVHKSIIAQCKDTVFRSWQRANGTYGTT